MRTRKTLVAGMLAAAATAVPLAGGVCLFSRQIMSFYGRDFVHGWPVLVLMVLTAALLAVQIPVGQIIAASGRMWLGLLMNSGWALALVGSFWFLRQYGALGLAASFLLAYVAHAVWTFAFAYAVTRPSPGEFGEFPKAGVLDAGANRVV